MRSSGKIVVLDVDQDQCFVHFFGLLALNDAFNPPCAVVVGIDIKYAKSDIFGMTTKKSAGRTGGSKIAVIRMPESYLSAVWGIKDLLDDAESRKPGCFETSIVNAEEFSRSRKRFDLVIIPPLRLGKRDAEALAGDPLVAAIGRAEKRGAIVCSVCAGAFYLCAAGIADGDCVTTHWNLAPALQSAFPRVTVMKEKVVIDRGRYISAGGVTSYQDLCLHLIKKYAGLETALATAGTFLINPEDRTQLQYMSLSLNVSDAGSDVAKAVAFMKKEFAKPIGLEDVAAHCALTVRTLLRRFRESGLGTPGDILQSLRLAHAKKILQSGTVSAKAAAAESGYRDLVSFSRAFRKYAGVNPGEYGRRFRQK
jgi:transcriptional regulator GlxA family with amidase domain